MKLHVFVHDAPVATLESSNGFEHVLTYHEGAAKDQFVSLLMPVRTKSYVYPELHPLFRMNLPEGFLLAILVEQFGPVVGSSPLDLLAVVGRNSIGRVKLAAPGADPTRLPVPFEVGEVLKGANSEAAFVDLVRRHAVSGVSGVVPKFLSTNDFSAHGKGALATERFIVKGTTSRLPGVALNEHFCMEVSRQAGIRTADTRVSDDGQVLVVSRFDYEADGRTRKGMEDLCSLLLLRPEEKYGSTWERVANQIKQVIANPGNQTQALSQLGDLLLLTLALRNADCHTKNMALLYSNREQVEFAPVYDMLTITAYDDYRNNDPGMSVEGKKKWAMGKMLEVFLRTRCFITPADTHARIERICEAMVQVSPQVTAAAAAHPHFRDTAKRMLHQWNQGMNALRLQKTWNLPSLQRVIEEARFSDMKPAQGSPRQKIGRSPLIDRRLF